MSDNESKYSATIRAEGLSALEEELERMARKDRLELLGELCGRSSQLAKDCEDPITKEIALDRIATLQTFAPCIFRTPQTAASWVERSVRCHPYLNIHEISELLQLEKLWLEVQSLRNPLATMKSAAQKSFYMGEQL